jgi:DNA polymerase
MVTKYDQQPIEHDMLLTHLFVDIETRSVVDLTKTGVYPYAQHPETEIICLAGQLGGNKPWVWLSPHFERLLAAQSTLWEIEDLPLVDIDVVNAQINVADYIVAHNVQFERVVLQNLGEQHGIVEIPTHKWRCSMARCGASGLPLGLGKAAKALGLEQEKSSKGHQLMLKMSRPKGD